MKEIKLKNGVKIKLHDNIDELPQSQFMQFEKMLMIEAGVGSDFKSFDSHLSKVFLFLSKDKKQEAIDELMNMRKNTYMIFEEFDIKTLALACLIDYKAQHFSVDKAKKTSKFLLENGITNRQIKEVIEDVKKKYIAS